MTNWPALTARTRSADPARKPVRSIAVTGRGSRRSLKTPLRLRCPTTIKRRHWIIPSPPTPLALPSLINHWISGQANFGSNSGTSRSKPVGAPGNSSDSGEAKKPHLEGKLGADGKLTPEERQQRFDNNLCLFCGAAGHKANECHKWTLRANANAAQVTSDGDDSTSKND